MAKRIRELLRQGAVYALRQRGFAVQPVTGQGIVPGARLTAEKDGLVRKIAVRTSRDRKVGLMRHPSGRWRTIPKVDEVLIAVQAPNDPMLIEVLAFNSKTLIAAFDALVAKAPKAKRRKDAYKSPIFIALDKKPPSHQGQELEFGLKGKSDWSTTFPLNADMTGMMPVKSEAGFIERVKREFAELNGVDVGKVIVSFRIEG